MTQPRSSKVTHPGNASEKWIGTLQASSAEGVFRAWMEKAVSSTPEACGWGFIIRRVSGAALDEADWRKARLPDRPGLMEFVSQIEEVVLADSRFENFLDHRQEVR